MFTDQPVTPVRLEILVDLLRACPAGLARKDVYRLLQPQALNPDPDFTPSKSTVKAALDLGLAREDSGKLSLNDSVETEHNTRSSVLRAFDNMVLATSDVEPYFALFYGYYLRLGKTANTRASQSGEEWAKQFNRDVFLDETQTNPFNKDKFSRLHRWFDYVGLGWYDPSEIFQANPYERILRVLPKIFDGSQKLSSEDFMKKLAKECPELDGGEIFRRGNRDWKSSDKHCSLGLSHALIELHEDSIIRLDCPADCRDWSLKDAEPPRDDCFKGDRFATVEWRNK